MEFMSVCVCVLKKLLFVSVFSFWFLIHEEKVSAFLCFSKLRSAEEGAVVCREATRVDYRRFPLPFESKIEKFRDAKLILMRIYEALQQKLIFLPFGSLIFWTT